MSGSWDGQFLYRQLSSCYSEGDYELDILKQAKCVGLDMRQTAGIAFAAARHTPEAFPSLLTQMSLPHDTVWVETAFMPDLEEALPWAAPEKITSKEDYAALLLEDKDKEGLTYPDYVQEIIREDSELGVPPRVGFLIEDGGGEEFFVQTYSWQVDWDAVRKEKADFLAVFEHPSFYISREPVFEFERETDDYRLSLDVRLAMLGMTESPQALVFARYVSPELQEEVEDPTVEEAIKMLGSSSDRLRFIIVVMGLFDLGLPV